MAQDQNALELFNYLSSRTYSAPLAEILEAFEWSRATFFRVKGYAELLYGVCIEYDKKYEGYVLKKQKGAVELPGPHFTVSEITSLVLIEHALQSLQKGQLCDFLEPIRKRFLPLLKSRNVPVDTFRKRFKILSVFCRSVDDSVFRTVFDSITRQRRLQITYRALGTSEAFSRIVSPQTILRYRDNWYLDAFCHQKQALRCFAMSRITDARITKEHSRVISDTVLRKHYTHAFGIFTGQATREATIRFTGVAAHEIPHETWHPAQKGEKQPDGSYILTVPYGNDTELVMDILKWGRDAEVLKPARLRKKVGEILREAARRYEKK
ncbi:MAG: helix-turn-helix transcriptional regulator [Chitinispirillaceae bacterium]